MRLATPSAVFPGNPATLSISEVALPEMVTLSPGRFWMGADDEQDKFASVLEKPRHEVTIRRPFALSRTPITCAQWCAFTRGDCGDSGQFPICNVSWNDAQAYVRWLARKTGHPYRLPSEAEWEFACRAGTTTGFHTGDGISVQDANFLYLDFGDKPGLGRPVDVGSYPPNAFGLQDMHGNVCELVEDVWHDTYDGAPADGSPWLDPPQSPWRVVRGGGWDAMPRILRSAFRDWVGQDQRMDNMGFRVAYTL